MLITDAVKTSPCASLYYYGTGSHLPDISISVTLSHPPREQHGAWLTQCRALSILKSLRTYIFFLALIRKKSGEAKTLLSGRPSSFSYVSLSPRPLILNLSSSGALLRSVIHHQPRQTPTINHEPPCQRHQAQACNQFGPLCFFTLLLSFLGTIIFHAQLPTSSNLQANAEGPVSKSGRSCFKTE